MNYIPFTFVKSIHEAQHGSLHTDQRRHNDGLMPQPSLMPDPIGLLFSQIHSAIERAVARTIQRIFHPMPARQEDGTHNLPAERKPQPLASAVAKQIHTEVIRTETEKNNGIGYESRPLST